MTTTRDTANGNAGKLTGGGLWEAKSPNTACVFLSPLSIGVPVKPMNDALGSASRICYVKPSTRSLAAW